MEYKILGSFDGIEEFDLQELVAEAIKDGWTPQGGLAIASGSDWVHLYQAMVRQTDER